MPKDSKQLLKGAFVLTIAAFIVKILSAVYRVPFQNIVGDIGFYIYQQAYPLYGMASVLASSGFSVVFSKMVAERVKLGKVEMERTLQAAFFTLFLIGCSLFLIIFFGARSLAHLMGDPLLTPVIQVIAFYFLFLPFISVGRGYFQGIGNMVPTASSQVVEQFVRITILLSISFFLVRQEYSLYEVGRGAWASTIVGGLASLALLGFFVRKEPVRLFKLKGIALRDLFDVGKVVLFQGTAICISSLLLILFQFVDSLNVFSLLSQTGIGSNDAKALKGVFDRGQPLIQLGTVVATAFALALVPSVARAWSQGNDRMLQQHVQTALKLSLLVGAGASVGLINIMKPTNMMLFKNTDGSTVLAVLAIAVLLTSLIITYAAILQGLGYMFAPAKYILFGVAVKFICNQWLVPRVGTMGASLATVIALTIVLCLLIVKLNKHLPRKVTLLKRVPTVMLSLLIMTVMLQLWQHLFAWAGVSGRLWSAFIALTGVGIGGVAYIFILLRMQFLTEKELHMLPFGRKLIALAHRLERKRK